jgi:hypothetical protein
MTKSKKRPMITKSTDSVEISMADIYPNQENIPSSNVTLQQVKRAPAKRSVATKNKHNKVIVSTTNAPTTTTPTTAPPTTPNAQIANIILHLNCSLKDLEVYNEENSKKLVNLLSYNPTVPPDLLTYNQYDTVKNYSSLDGADLTPPHEEDYAYGTCQNVNPNVHENNTLNETTNETEFETTTITQEMDSKNEMKEIYKKLKKLKISLFKNMAYMEKKSACFWCTYDFDNPECYIPKYEIDGSIHGYGSFCRPECAAAYLMKEHIDDSTKFERYHLLNQIYSKIFDYKKNIKPAPNPYYMLDKFYGNMSIQEYRKLLKSQHLLFVIEKPLTRILPELHEDNDEFLSNIYGTSTIGASSAGQGTTTTTKTYSTGVYKVRRQSDKPVTNNSKTNIIKEHFGIK